MKTFARLILVIITFMLLGCQDKIPAAATPLAVVTVREMSTVTATRPPTATPIPTDTPVPPTPTFTSTPTDTPTMPPTNTPTITHTITPIPECVGAFPTRLSVGDRAKVINYQLNVRSGPGTQHSVIDRLSINREVTILNGPQCSDGQLWYYIVSDVFTNSAGARIRVEGWSVEESDDVYFLEPID